MIYSFAITTLNRTPKEDKQETKLELTKGIIHQVDFMFPAGCAGLAHIVIYRGANQIWPTNAIESFHTDDETITFSEYYRVETDPYMLSAYTWNLDRSYGHTIFFRVGILQESEIRGVWIPWSEEVIMSP